MRLKRTAFDQVRDAELRGQVGRPADQINQAGHHTDVTPWNDQIAHAQRRQQRLTECAEIQDAAIWVQTLQRWRRGTAASALPPHTCTAAQVN